MNKGKKIISTLAIASMLAGNVLPLASLAATAGVESGVYTVGESKIVGFRLSQAQATTPLKLSDVEEKVGTVSKLDGENVSDKTTAVKTGSVVTTEKGDYTVVIYGDVDQSGLVDMQDALAIARYAAERSDAQLKDAALEAADVGDHNKEVDMQDALAIARYAAERSDAQYVIDPMPESDPEQEVPGSNYTVTFNEKNIINNVNISASAATIKLKELTSEEVTNVSPAKIVVVKADKSEVDLKTNIAITPYTSQLNVSLGDLSKNTNIVEGTNKAKLVDKNGKTLSEFTFEKSTTSLPKAAAVTTERISTPEATMSFKATADSNVVKMYYVVLPILSSAPTTFTALTKSVDITDNKLENIVIANDLQNDQAYKVYYVLENSDGSRSPWTISTKNKPSEYIITKDSSAVTTEEAVKEVTAPELDKEAAANFTWTLKTDATASNGYKVALYKDGKIVKEVSTKNKNYDFTADMKKAGTYKVSVVVKGSNDGSSKDSSAIESSEVVVTALNSVTNVKFTVNEKNENVLSWESTYSENDITGYNVDIYKFENGEYTKVESPISVNDGKKETVLASLESNTIYQARITTVAKTAQLAIVNSEEAVSDDFFFIQTKNITAQSTTTNSVTLRMTPQVTVEGKTTTYSVEIWEVTGSNGEATAKYNYVRTQENITMTDVKNGQTVTAGELVVDGLESGKTYIFKVIAKVDGVEGKSGFVPTNGTTTKKEIPAIVDLEVSSKSGEGKISQTGSSTSRVLNINGVEIKYAEFAQYPAEIAKISDIMVNLVNGDVITLENNKLTVKLQKEASGVGVALRNFGSLTGMILELQGNKYSKTISVSAADDVILTGTDAIFNIANVTATKVTLKNSVNVTTGANKKVVVAEGATATINNVKVTAAGETEITTPVAGEKTLNITANNGSNELIFENTTTGEAKISIVGATDLSSSQSGTITIKSTGGKVTLTASNLNVASDVVVDVENGDVVITDTKFSGSKNVTVSNAEGETTTVTALLENTVTTKAFVSQFTIGINVDATDDELKSYIASTSVELKDLRAYLDSFKLNGTGAILKIASATATTVEIEISSIVTDVTIGNIK